MQTDHLPLITTEELRLRDGKQTPEIWVAYEGKVYDVTESRLFKGGKHFRHPTGIDLTDQMPYAPHTDRVFAEFRVVGLLSTDEA